MMTESVAEDAARAWLDGRGHGVLHGPEIAVGMSSAERTDPGYRRVVPEHRLRQAPGRPNPNLPPEVLDDAFRKFTRADGPSLIERNRAVHRMLADGVTVEYRRADGSISGAQAPVIEFDTFFATVQNKMHWAAHGRTAAEVIAARADADRPDMGLVTWAGDVPRKTDVSVARNYLAAGWRTRQLVQKMHQFNGRATGWCLARLSTSASGD